MIKSTGWEAVVAALKEEGIKYVFGMPSSTQDLYDALYDEPTIEAIQVRHEVAGGFMAMAYSLLTGEPAVCFTSQGPGITNLTSAMLESLATCAPVIAICPGTDGTKDGKGAFQETDQMGIMKPITKWAYRVEQAEQIPWAISRAFYLATNGKPGPIYIEIPTNIGRGEYQIPKYVSPPRRLRYAADSKSIKEAIDLLLEAERPLIISGGGARHSRAHKEVRRLSEILGAPIMTTPSGRGIVTEDYPLYFGQVGLYRNEIGIDINQETDLIITIGSRNEEFQTGGWRFLPKNCKLIQIDIDAFEINRNWIPDVPILGDAKLVLKDLINKLDGEPRDKWAERAKKYADIKLAFDRKVAKECEMEEDTIKSKRVVYEINQVFGKNTILMNENGSQDLWSYYSPYYKVLDLDGNVAPGEQTCMGLGVMGAVGAKLAFPEKNVVCITGDGAFQMYNQDVPTAVQYDTPITWVILNSFSLEWPKIGQKELGGRYIATDFKAQPDFAQLAQSYGCYGEQVESLSNLRPALKRALDANLSGKSAILDIIIDPSELPKGFLEYRLARSKD